MPKHRIDIGNKVLRQLLIKGDPFLVGRLGLTETHTCCRYNGKRNAKYDKWLRYWLRCGVGLYPTEPMWIDHFAYIQLEALKQADAFAEWFIVPGEQNILDQHLKDGARRISPRSFNPLLSKKPWSLALEGKRVLVVHPFATTIEKQYLKREELHASPILPRFELQTVKAVQSIMGNEPHKDWRESLHHMWDEIRERDFDVALLACGGYGLPLAGFIRSEGMSAIHVGGVLQLMFGIRGKRWESSGLASEFMNKHWVRPSSDERPENYRLVEGGCYW